MLGAAGVVGAAGARARVVGAARRDALVAVLDADEVRERQGVLGDVGLGAVGAEAAVGQFFLCEERGASVFRVLHYLDSLGVGILHDPRRTEGGVDLPDRRCSPLHLSVLGPRRLGGSCWFPNHTSPL